MFSSLNKVRKYIFTSKNANVARISAAFALDLLNTTINLLPPILVAKAADARSKEGKTPEEVTTDTYLIVAAFGASWLAGKTLPIIRNMILNPVRTQVQSELTAQLLRKTYDLELNEHLSTPSGEFATLLTKNYTSLNDIVPSLFSEITPTLTEATAATAVLSYMYGPVGAVEMGILLLYTAAAYWGTKLSSKVHSERVLTSFETYGKLLSAISRYEVANQFGNVEFEVNEARKQIAKLNKAFLKSHVRDDLNKLVTTVINGAGFTGIMLYSTYELANKELTTFDFIVMGYYFSQFGATLSKFGEAINKLNNALIDFDKITNFLAKKSSVADKLNPIELTLEKPPVISFENVSFDYPGKKDTLTNINFTVEAGHKVAVVGESASGKSTLIKLLLRFYKLKSGSIKINGIDINDLSQESLRNAISVVSQNTDLSSTSVYDNIKYGDQSATDEDVRIAANFAGLGELLEGDQTKGGGLSAQVGEKGDMVSGGQKQRVTIARALLKGGSIIVMDEPTSALDPKNELKVQETLDKISSCTTSICVTHKLLTTINADKIYYLDHGKIVEEGSFSELIQLQGKFYAQLLIQCKALGIDPNDLIEKATQQAKHEQPAHNNELVPFLTRRKNAYKNKFSSNATLFDNSSKEEDTRNVIITIAEKPTEKTHLLKGAKK